MKQCTITHEGETCIVVWLRMPPINNLFLFLVHTEQGGVVEPITVPVAIPLDENKCCFLPVSYTHLDVYKRQVML